MKRIGLALGAGGARGLAHIKILEAFDELQIKPVIISGSSMGAVIGAAYASGLSAEDIKNKVNSLLKTRQSKAWEFYKNSELKLLLNLLDIETNSGGFIKGEKFRKFMEAEIKAKKFKDLEIPLKVVATDFWNKTQKVFQSGDLIPAITASYSLPGLFAPAVVNGNLYVDGGMVNPIPYDIIQRDCDFVIAIDVSAKKSPKDKTTPPFYEIVFSAFQIMQNSILNEKLKISRPDLLLRTNIENIRLLDFAKTEEIFDQTRNVKKQLVSKLKELSK